VLVHAFDQALRLLHPIVPFITEALWQRLPGHVDGEFIARAPWPVRRGIAPEPAGFELVQEVIIRIRQLRSDFAIAPGKPVTVHVAHRGDTTNDGAAERFFDTILREEAPTIERLARATLSWEPIPAGTPNAKAAIAGGATVAMLLDGAIDVARERMKYAKELAELEKQLGSLEKRLASPGFTSKAKPEVVESERAKLAQWTAKREHLAALVQSLAGA
jgi:valyl-tRNA synthetase